MAKSTLRGFIEGYEQSDGKNGESRGKKFFSRSFSGNVTPAMLHFSKRGILKLFTTLSKGIQYLSTKALGSAVLAFGIVTIILSFLADYGSATGQAATISFIIGVALALIAIPLLLSDGTFAYIFQNSKVFDKILFDFLCINRVPRSESAKSMPIALMAVFGALLGFLGYFIPVWWVLFIVATTVFVYLAFGSPEFAFFSTFLMFPLVSMIPYGYWALTSLVLLSSVSFVRKVLSGKRVFSIEQYDIAVLFMIVLILISGVFAKGESGILNSLITASVMLGYFIASNVITNRRLADCMLVSIVVSSIAPLAATFYEAVNIVRASSINSLLTARIFSTFNSTDSYAVFLLVVIACSIALIRQSSGFVKFLFTVGLILNAIALVLCSEPFAMLALTLGIILYVVLGSRKSWTGKVTVLLALLPYVAVFVINLVNPEILSIGAITSLWGDALGVFVYNIVVGIGVGMDSFVLAMGELAAGFTSSSNIFISIGLEMGIFALAAFVLILLIRVKHRTIYHGYIKHSEIAMISPVIAIATLSIVAFGTTSNVFGDPASYYLFWCVFGAGSATLRVAKREYDERVMYFEDAIDSELSVVDVKIV
jgi:hypothetical protein